MPISLYHDLNEPELIRSEEELRRRLRISNNICYSLNSISILVCIFSLVLGIYNKIFFWFFLIYPLVALWFYIRLERIVSFIDNFWEARHFSFIFEITMGRYKRSAHPTLFVAMISPVFVLALIFREYYMLSHAIYGVAVAPALVFLIIVIDRIRKGKLNKERMRPLYIVGFSVFIILFTYCLVMLINCKYDHSVPVRYAATVIDRETFEDRHSKTYYIVLSKWGPMKQGAEIRIDPHSTFDITIGAQVYVYLYRGALGIQWYEVP